MKCNLLVIVFCCSLAASIVAALEIDKTPTTELFVGPSGSDTADGTNNAPFRTIARAQSAAREAAQRGNADVVVNLLPGEYRLEQSLLFTEADSGRNGYRVFYRSAAGPGKAKILGSNPLTGWQQHDHGIWKIRLPKGTVFHSLYENGVRLHKARFPDYELNPLMPTALGRYLASVDGSPERIDKVADKRKPGETAWLAYGPEDAPPATPITKMRIHIFPGGKRDWVREIHRVIAIDPVSRRIEFSNEPIHGVGAGARFFLEDELALLNAPGEFFLDQTTDTLYCKPLHDGKPDTLGIRCSVLNRLIQIKGQSHERCAERLVFDGLCLEETDDSPPEHRWAYDGYSDGAILWMSNTSQIEVRNCHLNNSGRHGIMMIGHNVENVVAGCWIEHTGLNGISLCNHFLGPKGKGTTDGRCERNTITNTRISHIGESYTYAECVTVFNASNNEVDHCLLDNAVRYAITLRGNTGAQYGPPVCNDFPPTKGNRFHHIRIERCGQDGGDMGALHCAALNNPGGGCVNVFEQITVSDTAAIASVKDVPPDGIFLDWPKMAMDQVFRNIEVTGSQGAQFRSHKPENGESAQTENVSWKPDFCKEQMDYEHIGLTPDYPKEFSSQ